MKTLLRPAILAAALCASAAAQATAYHFSYQFASGETVSGSFDGTANGDLITGISNASVSFAGSSLFSGSNYLYSFAGNSFLAGGAVISISGTANNFILIDRTLDLSTITDSNLFAIDAASASAAANQVTGIGSNNSVTDAPYAGASYDAARWHVAAVPEPVTYGMLLGGLGLMGAATRRRNQP